MQTAETSKETKAKAQARAKNLMKRLDTKGILEVYEQMMKDEHYDAWLYFSSVVTAELGRRYPKKMEAYWIYADANDLDKGQQVTCLKAFLGV